MNAVAAPFAMADIDPLLQVLALSKRARSAGSQAELAFLAVNDTHALHAYRQAALWMRAGGIVALSGVVDPDANAPYAQWLQEVCRHLGDKVPALAPVSAADLPAELAQEWAEWLPTFGLWIPLPPQAEASPAEVGGLLLAADQAWSPDALAWLAEWMAAWHHAWVACRQGSRWRWWTRWSTSSTTSKGRWRRHALVAGVLLAVMCLPVKLSVLAPGELVPAHPAMVRAPLDGIVAQFHVQPNQMVKAGQPLFSFDQAALAARHEVAAQSLATAEAEYRQFAQQAVSDNRSKTQLSPLLGRIEEKRAEAGYLQDQFQRTTVNAPQDGVVMFDDPSEWAGKPVQTGEKIMRIAAPHDVEVEAWLPIGDAIPLTTQAHVELYLAASPLAPISAQLRYIGHDAMLRPDGQYAYRVRARLTGSTDQRVGLKGTAKISGDSVPLAYWVIRRPLATVRQTMGW